MTRKPWTREQLIKTLSLYHQLPFGKMHARNPTVVSLAHDLERTPSAVAYKLVNFGSLDPELRKRGVVGMQNTSQADRDVWNEFFGKWEALASKGIVLEPPNEVLSQRKRSGRTSPPTGPTEVMREVVQRRGQCFFRAAVLAAHDYRCCITGISSEPLLRASHIVPWSVDPALRLDPHNGLCLNALHDAAFDRGLITLSEKFELVVSKRVKDEVPRSIFRELFEGRAGAPIMMPERCKPSVEMLDFHRTNVFSA